MAGDAAVSLLERARQVGQASRLLCGVEMAKREHPALADQIEELIAAWPSVQYSTQVQILRDAGIDLKYDTLSRHHRALCSCPR